MRYPARSVLICAILTAAAAAAMASDWPHWRGPAFDGVSAETDWSEPFVSGKVKILWSASVGTGFSSIAVSDGRACTVGFSGNRDTLYCLDAVTGKELWTYSYAAAKGAKYYEGGPHATPTFNDGNVYAVSKWGWVFCLDAATGKELWKRNVAGDHGFATPTWGFASSALVVGETVYLNLGDSGVALNKADGTTRWASGKGASGYATPVPYKVDGQLRLAIFGKNSLMGIAAKDGKVLWSFPWQTRYDVNAADPIVSGRTMFISSGYNRGCALVNLESGKPEKLWENRNMRNQFNSCVRLDGYLYGFDESTLTCLKFSDGSKTWTRDGLGKGSLMRAGNTLIILSERGELVLAEASGKGFKQLAAKRILSGKCWSAPVLANGRIYARNAAGKFVCVGPNP